MGLHGSKIITGLENAIKLKNIDMKSLLSVMKTIHAKQSINLSNEFTLVKLQEITTSESKACSINDTVKMVLLIMGSLGPFVDSELLHNYMENVDFAITHFFVISNPIFWIRPFVASARE